MVELLIGVAAMSLLGIATIVGNKLSKPVAYSVARRRLKAGLPNLVDGAVVTLVGTVRPIDLLTAPLSRRSCVALHVKTFIGPTWITRFAMTQFVLETEQGEVTVEHFPDAGLALPKKRFHPTYELAEKFLVAIGRFSWEARRAEFEEIVVEPGARVSVYGVISTEIAPPAVGAELGFRDTTQVIRLIGTYDHPLAIGEV